MASLADFPVTVRIAAPRSSANPGLIRERDDGMGYGMTRGAAALVLALALAGCGGGGGGGPANPGNTTSTGTPPGDGGGSPQPTRTSVSPADAFAANPRRLADAGRRAIAAGSRASVSSPDFGSVFQSVGGGVTEAWIALRDGALHIGVGDRTTLNSNDHLYLQEPSASPTRRAAEYRILLDYGDGHITAAAGTVDRDPSGFGDWIAGGYWLRIDGDWRNGGVDSVGMGAVVDGPEFSRSAGAPGIGTAGYSGLAAGLYAAVAGSDGSTPGAAAAGEYEGRLTATADFGAGTVSGEIDRLSFRGAAVYPDGRTRGFTDATVPVRRLVLEPGEIGENGSVTGNVSIEVGPGYRIASQSGSWGARLSSMDDGDGNPRAFAGTHAGTATTAGGSEAVFVGVHAGSTEGF